MALFPDSVIFEGTPKPPRHATPTTACHTLAEEENCSLFLVGLPPNLTTTSLLGRIRGMGCVYATHINPPEPDKDHDLSAAKLVFFERPDADSGPQALLEMRRTHIGEQL
ncbi:hypothetical protein QBC44DRAFT_373353 [Cladorrhinum sp. PSN332]|nr:hypothetical protein QBC44DRAFT_373353 [Cladorrhinum sp. PSN332]